MQRKKIALSFCFMLCGYTRSNEPRIQHGVVIVPVADLVNGPYSDKTYESIPFAENESACPRLHQLLFNDKVEILKEQNDSVLISLKHVFSSNGVKKNPPTYWMRKSAIKPLKDIKIKHHQLALFPPERDYRGRQSCLLVTLKKPFYEKTTGFTFSAGTQFVRLKKHTDFYSVAVFNPKKSRFFTLSLPKEYCTTERTGKEWSKEKKQKQFVKLLKEWAHDPAGTIPYVWGGTSLVRYDNAPVAIKTGFDCTGLIMRAAQLCKIPYPFKNTTTIAQYLKPVAENQTVIEGDIISFKGHVLVITDIEKNLVIEAAGYKTGYGGVHEIECSKIFKDKPTLASLIAAYHAKEPLERIYKDGTIEYIQTFKILQFASVWHQHT